MKAAIYCRVSTEGQEQDGTSLQTQLEACLKYCKLKNYEVEYRFKEAFSGLALERPELRKLREVVRSGGIDVLVVYSLDRFSRDPVHGVILMQELDKYCVMLEAATEQVDNSEAGKLIFYIKGYAAKLDAERRRDATGRGKAALLKAGKLPQGNGVGIYGYKWVPEYKKRTPIEHEAKIIQRMFEMVAGGKSCFTVARILNEDNIPTKTGKKWEPRTVSRILRNPAYIGITIFGQTSGKDHKQKPKEEWHILHDVTPPIISEELFNRTQQAMDRSKELHVGKAKFEYLLTGLAICGHCGSPLVGSCINNGRYRYYHCRGTYPTASRQRICDARYIKADLLEDVVWQQVKSVLSNPEVLLSNVRSNIDTEKGLVAQGTLGHEIKVLTRNLKQYAGQERRLMKVLRMGVATPDIVLDEINQMKKEKEADQTKLTALVQTKEKLAKMDADELKLRELCARIVPNLDNCTARDKKDAYAYLGLQIKATPEGADICGYLELASLTTGQTSALSRGCNCLPLRV